MRLRIVLTWYRKALSTLLRIRPNSPYYVTHMELKQLVDALVELAKEAAHVDIFYGYNSYNVLGSLRNGIGRTLFGKLKTRYTRLSSEAIDQLAETDPEILVGDQGDHAYVLVRIPKCGQANPATQRLVGHICCVESPRPIRFMGVANSIRDLVGYAVKAVPSSYSKYAHRWIKQSDYLLYAENGINHALLAQKPLPKGAKAVDPLSEAEIGVTVYQ